MMTCYKEKNKMNKKNKLPMQVA